MKRLILEILLSYSADWHIHRVQKKFHLNWINLKCCRGPSLAPVCVYVCLCVCMHGDVSREELFVIQCHFCVLVAAGCTCLISHDFIHFSFDYILRSLRLFAQHWIMFIHFIHVKSNACFSLYLQIIYFTYCHIVPLRTGTEVEFNVSLELELELNLILY